jgi:LysR family carnitine catabolism transcriptional activator
MNLSLHQLKVFIAVARHGGFTRASERLHLSQPSLTLLVKQLEDELNVRLFDRTTRRVELTTAGEELLPIAERIFSELELTAQSLRDLGNVKRGRVVVAALPSMSATLLPQAIAQFRERYPDIQVQLKDGVAGEVVEMVQLGHAELGVGSFSGIEPDLELTPITKDRMFLICRVGHPLAKLREVPWRAIVDYPFVAMRVGSSVRYETDRAFAAIGVSKMPDQEVSLLTTMFGLAKAGLAVTAMPGAVMRAFNVEGVVKLPLVSPVIERELGIVTRRGRMPSPAAAALIKSIRQTSQAL